MESKPDERIEIDKTINDRYRTLTNEWQSAEEIVTKLDIQRANHRKKLSVHLEPTQNTNETTLSTFKSVFSKISLPTFDVPERKYSNMSNDVFYEVYFIKKILCFKRHFFQESPIHTVTIPIDEETNESSVIIARTRQESVIDRSSPYSIIETSTDDEDDDIPLKPSEDTDEAMITEQPETISPSSSITSATEVYMDAIDIVNDEQSG